MRVSECKKYISRVAEGGGGKPCHSVTCYENKSSVKPFWFLTSPPASSETYAVYEEMIEGLDKFVASVCFDDKRYQTVLKWDSFDWRSDDS